MTKRYVIVADDLTGANDTGIQFLKAGYSSSVVLDPSALAFSAQDAAVVDTESRNLPEAEAREVLGRVALYLRPLRGRRVIYKKVDSTLRGNIGAEVEVLRRALKPALTVFTPSYPANGRTVREGLCLLNGVPVAETEVGRDPRKPIVSSSIGDAIDSSGTLGFRPIFLDELRSEAFPSLLQRDGGAVLTFDAETASDLRRVVTGVTRFFPPEEVLWVGSAGLAEALVAPPPALLVAGSLSRRCLDQSRYVLERGLAAPVSIDVAKLLMEPRAAVEEAARSVRDLLRGGQNVLLSSILEERQVERGRKEDAGLAVARGLAAVVAEAVEAEALSGLFLTGGEVAIHVLRVLGGTGTVLLDEVEPGIPRVLLSGGGQEGLSVVTKAGSFGSEEVMARVLGAFERRGTR